MLCSSSCLGDTLRRTLKSLVTTTQMKSPGMYVSHVAYFYSESLTNLLTRSSTIRRYFRFILSFRKLFPISFVVSSGTCIYLSSTLLIRASVNPICAPNRSKSKRHGCPVLSYTSLFSISGDKLIVLNRGKIRCILRSFCIFAENSSYGENKSRRLYRIDW